MLGAGQTSGGKPYPGVVPLPGGAAGVSGTAGAAGAAGTAEAAGTGGAAGAAGTAGGVSPVLGPGGPQTSTIAQQGASEQQDNFLSIFYISIVRPGQSAAELFLSRT